MVTIAESSAYAESRRRPRVGLVIAVVAALLLAGLYYLWETHHPSLELYDGESERLLSAPHTFEQIQPVHNTGRFAQHITAVASSERGVVMTSSNAVGQTVQPGRTARIVVFYRVTDCSYVLHKQPGPRDQPFPVHLTIRRWWGTESATIVDNGSDFNGGATDACLGHLT